MAEGFITRRGEGDRSKLKKTLLQSFSVSLTTAAVDRTLTLDKPIKKYRGIEIQTSGVLYKLAQYSSASWTAIFCLDNITNGPSYSIFDAYATNQNNVSVSNDTTICIIPTGDGSVYIGNPYMQGIGRWFVTLDDAMQNSATFVLRSGYTHNGGQMNYTIYTLE